MNLRRTRKSFLYISAAISGVFILSLFCMLGMGLLLDWGAVLVFVATTFGIIVTLLAFYQRQNLEEFALFNELFKDFNKRFDNLNKDLNRIVRDSKDDPSKELTLDDRSTLNDYFNLCAEEYFYYTQGYIHPEVWETWRKGILDYLSKPCIKELWEVEEKTESYYGMTIDKIENPDNK